MTTDNQPALQPPELAHCPFCPYGWGFFRNESGRYNGVIWVECDWPSHAVRLTADKDAQPPCGARTAEYQTEEEAAKAWNTRARVVDGVVATVDHEALTQLLDGALLHPERAEGYIRQVIETLATTAPIAAPVED